MILRTWSGSRIETRGRHWSIWFRWALGWLRHSRDSWGICAVIGWLFALASVAWTMAGYAGATCVVFGVVGIAFSVRALYLALFT